MFSVGLLTNPSNQSDETCASPVQYGRGGDRQMTKFDELFAAYKDASARWTNYERRSYSTAHAMRADIANFLGCPVETVQFRPVLKDVQDATQYSAAGAMEI